MDVLESPPERKRCSACDEWKTLDQFSARNDRDGKYQSWCRACNRKANRAAYYRDKTPTRRRWLKQYGLTLEDYDELFEFQGGRCWICRRPPKRKALAVDHDHRTGRVRGLLCGPCNQLLGILHEDAELFTRAGQYLNRPPANDVFVTPRRHINAPPVMEND